MNYVVTSLRKCVTSVRDAAATVNMADQENRTMEVDKGEDNPSVKHVKSVFDEGAESSDKQKNPEGKTASSRTTTEYCEKLQTWMWQYYTGYVNWQSCLAASAMSCPYYLQPASGTSTATDFNPHTWHNNSPFGLPLSPYPPVVNSPSGRAGEAAVGAAAAAQQQLPQANGNAQRPGKIKHKNIRRTILSILQPDPLYMVLFTFFLVHCSTMIICRNQNALNKMGVYASN